MTYNAFFAHRAPDQYAPIWLRTYSAYILTAIITPVVIALAETPTGLPDPSDIWMLLIMCLMFLLGGCLTGFFVSLPLSLVWYAVTRVTGENLLLSLGFGATTGFGLTALVLAKQGVAMSTTITGVTLGLIGGLCYWIMASKDRGPNPTEPDLKTLFA